MKKSEIAAKLLNLEKLSRSRKFSDDEAAEWQSLVAQIFGSDYQNKRKSFRLPIGVDSEITYNGKIHKAQLVELSHIGVGVACAGLKNAGVSERFSISSVQVDGQLVKIDLQCKVMTVANNERDIVGSTFDPSQPMEQRKKFHDQIYYPFYISYLERLAGYQESDHLRPVKIVK